MTHSTNSRVRRWTSMLVLAGIGGGFFAAATPVLAAEPSEQDANKKAVVEFYERALNEKDFAAAEPYLGNRYVQHNPGAPDGIDGFRNFIGLLKEKYPQSHSEIKQVFADGDYVILHVHAVREPGSLGSAIVDIFKLENGKIVEHWDVVQPIPEKSANKNTMF